MVLGAGAGLVISILLSQDAAGPPAGRKGLFLRSKACPCHRGFHRAVGIREPNAWAAENEGHHPAGSHNYEGVFAREV